MSRSGRVRLWRAQRRAEKRLRRRTDYDPSQIVTSFDAWAHLDELQRSVCAALSAAGVEFLSITDRTLPHPLVAIRATDVHAALTALASSEATRGCKVAPMFRRAPGPRAPVARHHSQLPGVTGWLVTKDLFSPPDSR